MKRATAAVVTGVLVLAIALPARAATSTVQMLDIFKFSPNPTSVAIGDTVRWQNSSDNSFTHTATSNAGWFNTGNVPPGSQKSKLFPYGGAFAYHCNFHQFQGMVGKISVPDQWLNTGTQHAGDVQRIRVAAVAAPQGLAYDVQMRTTGDDTWTSFKVKAKTAVVKFTPNESGEFQFRSRVHRLSNNKVSGYGPPAFVEISS